MQYSNQGNLFLADRALPEAAEQLVGEACCVKDVLLVALQLDHLFGAVNFEVFETNWALVYLLGVVLVLGAFLAVDELVDEHLRLRVVH